MIARFRCALAESAAGRPQDLLDIADLERVRTAN